MKEDITRLCREVIAVFREMLSEEDWLTEETRAKAIEKLDAIRVIAVYPEKWPDYNGLSLDGLGLCDSIHAINRYKAGISASLADQPVDHDLWYCTLDNDWANDILETNATYNPGDNGITIFRGILGNAFYREDMSDEELYGAIGLIIAHEISHAFDPTGAQFDATGRMNSWWTEADNAAFAARAQKLIDYYNGMTLFNGLQIPGKNIQGEAVADMGAVKCMLRLLEQKKGCLLAPIGRTDILAEHLIRLLTSPEEYREISAEALENIGRFNVDLEEQWRTIFRDMTEKEQISEPDPRGRTTLDTIRQQATLKSEWDGMSDRERKFIALEMAFPMPQTGPMKGFRRKAALLSRVLLIDGFQSVFQRIRVKKNAG